MAYAYDPNLDPDRDDEEQSQTIAAGGQMSAGSPQESAAEARPGSKIEDRFQNIDAYLKGNESKQFGSQVAGRVQSEVDKASQAQSEADRDFRSRSDQGTTRFDEGLTNKAIQDPESFLTSPEFNKFVSQRDAQYAGPSSLSDTQDLESRADGTTRAAASKARATESESGRFGLLDDYFARPSYTQGEKTLDQALVQTDKSAEPAFQRAQSSAKQNVANLETMRRNLSDYAAQNRGLTEQARSQTRGALDTAIGDVRTGVESRLSQRQGQQAADRTAIEGALRSRDLTQLTPELRQILGLEDVEAFYGVDPTQFLSTAELSAERVATPDEAKRFDALSRLADMENTFLNPELAGTMDDEALLGFDSSGFRDQVRSAQTQRQQLAAQEINSPTKDTDFPTYFDGKGGGALPDLRGKSLQERFNELTRLSGMNLSPMFTGGTLEQLNTAIATERRQVRDAIQRIQDKYRATDTLRRA